MKKIICLLLAVTCIFAMASCGSKASIEDVIANSKPTEVTTFVDYMGTTDKLEGRYTTRIDGAKSLMEYSYQRYAEPSEMHEGRIKTVTGTVWYYNGQVSHDEGATWVSSTTQDVVTINLRFEKDKFETYEYSDDGNSITATLKAEYSERVLGVAIDTATNAETGEKSLITLAVNTNGTYLYSVRITYVAVSGATVDVNTSYTYSPVTLDFGIDEAPAA